MNPTKVRPCNIVKMSLWHHLRPSKINVIKSTRKDVAVMLLMTASLESHSDVKNHRQPHSNITAKSINDVTVTLIPKTASFQQTSFVTAKYNIKVSSFVTEKYDVTDIWNGRKGLSSSSDWSILFSSWSRCRSFMHIWFDEKLYRN